MGFSTLMYHEIRKKEEFHPEDPSSIDVEQDYHDILPSPLFVTLEHFEEQMDYLHKQDYHTLTLDEVKGLLSSGKTSSQKNQSYITFDDCFQSIKKICLSYLKEI